MKRSNNFKYNKKEVAFPLDEYKSRIKKLRDIMNVKGLDCLLTFSRESSYYITGSRSGSGFLSVIVTLEGEPTLLVWGDSEIQLTQLTSWLSHENIVGWSTGSNPIKDLHKILKDKGLENKKIGLEDISNISLDNYKRVRAFEAKFFDSNYIKSLISIKSKREVDYIRKASTMTDKGMIAAINAVRDGVTDNDVARVACSALFDAGSEGFNMPQVNTKGIPHLRFRRRILEKGDSVLLEMSGVYNRYYSPLMRSVSIEQPSKRAIEIYEGCKVALKKVIENLIPGNTFNDVAKAGKEGIALIPKPYVFHKTYGYSMGFGFKGWADIENLRIIEGDKRVLKPGMVYHSTMSVRHPGKYGICLSETSLITENGSEQMSKIERKLFVAPTYL